MSQATAVRSRRASLHAQAPPWQRAHRRFRALGPAMFATAGCCLQTILVLEWRFSVQVRHQIRPATVSRSGSVPLHVHFFFPLTPSSTPPFGVARQARPLDNKVWQAVDPIKIVCRPMLKSPRCTTCGHDQGGFQKCPPKAFPAIGCRIRQRSTLPLPLPLSLRGQTTPTGGY